MKFLLLDADVVIYAHRLGVWDKLTASYKTALVSTVLRDEASFYEDPDTDARIWMVLGKELAAGKIHEVSATVRQQEEVRNQLLRLDVDLDPGELEALTVLKHAKEKCNFCTGDFGAVRGLVYLGLSDRGTSLEKVLGASVVRRTGLEAQFTERAFQLRVRTARVEYVQKVNL